MTRWPEPARLRLRLIVRMVRAVNGDDAVDVLKWMVIDGAASQLSGLEGTW
jgi:hypothetical protein